MLTIAHYMNLQPLIFDLGTSLVRFGGAARSLLALLFIELSEDYKPLRKSTKMLIGVFFLDKHLRMNKN